MKRILDTLTNLKFNFTIMSEKMQNAETTNNPVVVELRSNIANPTQVDAHLSMPGNILTFKAGTTDDLDGIVAKVETECTRRGINCADLGFDGSNVLGERNIFPLNTREELRALFHARKVA